MMMLIWDTKNIIYNKYKFHNIWIKNKNKKQQSKRPKLIYHIWSINNWM